MEHEVKRRLLYGRFSHWSENTLFNLVMRRFGCFTIREDTQEVKEWEGEFGRGSIRSGVMKCDYSNCFVGSFLVKGKIVEGTTLQS